MAKIQKLRCMMCGHEYSESVEEGEDKERSCPKCRSNSIRQLKDEKKDDKKDDKKDEKKDKE